MERYLAVGLTGAARAESEGKGHLFDGMETGADEDLEQELETGFLEGNLLDSFAAEEEEAGHGVVGAESVALDGQGDPDGDGRKETAHEIPVADAAAFGVAAADGQIVSGEDGGDELGKKLGGVLKVGIHDTEDGGVGVAPAVENGAGEPTLALADKDVEMGIGFGEAVDELFGAVTAVVVDDENLVVDADRIERLADAAEKNGQVFDLVEGGDGEGELLVTA